MKHDYDLWKVYGGGPFSHQDIRSDVNMIDETWDPVYYVIPLVEMYHFPGQFCYNKIILCSPPLQR